MESIILGLVCVVIGMLLYRKHKQRIDDAAKRVSDRLDSL